MAMPFINELLKKAMIRAGATNSVIDVYDETAGLYDGAVYVLKVLRSSHAIQAAVLAAAAASEEASERQLASILTLYMTLPKREQVRYISAYRNAAVLSVGAPRDITLRNTFQWNHVPPIYNP